MRRFDEEIGSALVARRGPVQDRVAWFGTQLGSFAAHVGVIGSGAIRAWRSERRAPVVYGIVSMAGTAAIYVGLKHSIRRERPLHTHLVATRDPSFPSGHSASAAAAARSLAEIHGLPKLPLALASTIVPVTRVYLGVHHPTDVIVGWLLGWTWASLVAAVIRPAARADEPSADADRSRRR